MAINKELGKFLDKDAKGQYKKTRKNISKLLFFYGYSVEDVQEVFGTKNEYYSRFLDDKMVRRDKPTATDFLSSEERELASQFITKIDKVYNKRVSSKGQRTTGRVNNNNRAKVSRPSVNVGLSEDDIQSPTLLNKLNKIADGGTSSQEETPSKTRAKIEDNIKDQRPIESERPESGVCETCGGRGWIMAKQEDGVVRKTACPDCLGQPVKINTEAYERQGEPLLKELIQNKFYLESTFSTRRLIDDNLEAYHSATRQFENYIEFLNSKITEVRGGEIPLKSYYIATPDGYGKKHFAYQLMKEAVNYGHKPTQLLNGGLLLDLYNKREFKELNELLEGDIVFVTLSALSRTNGLGNIIKYIADDAERRGVPVFMFGRVSVEVFLRDKDYNLPSLLSRRIDNGDYGHFQSEGFFGKDFNTLARLHQEKMSGTLV